MNVPLGRRSAVADQSSKAVFLRSIMTAEHVYAAATGDMDQVTLEAKSVISTVSACILAVLENTTSDSDTHRAIPRAASFH